MNEFHTSLQFNERRHSSTLQTTNGPLAAAAATLNYNLQEDSIDNTSSNGGTPSLKEGYESSQTVSNDGNGGGNYLQVPEHIQSEMDSSQDALSMSFRSMDLASDRHGSMERRGSIEVRYTNEDATRLNKKRAQKLRQMQSGCDGCTDGLDSCTIF